MSPDYNVGGGHPNLVRFSSVLCLWEVLFLFRPALTLAFSPFLLAKIRSKLKSRYKGCVRGALDYAKTIEDFDKLIDPRTLARHFLGPDPSPYVLRAIAREEKSKLLHLIFFFFFFLGNLMLMSSLCRSLQR